MARTVLPITQVNRGGTAAPTPQAGDTVNGHVVANSGRTIIQVQNTDAVTRNVTFVIPGLVDGQTVSPRTVAVAANTTLYFGGFHTDIYSSQMAITVDSALLKLIALEP